MVLIMALFISSCEKDLAQLNIDPTNPDDVNLNLLMPEILSSSAFNQGTNPARVAGMVLQQLYGIDAQQIAYTNYVLGEDVMNGYWGTGLYAGVLRSCDVIIKKSTEAARPFYGAVAKIVMANELGKATSMFGDIPFSQAFQGTDNLKPAYDSQESVYAAVQSLLDEAARDLEAMTDGGGYFGGDLVYGGDAAAWAKAAHAFKARYYIHTSKRNAGDVANAKAELAQAFGSNAENPTFQFTTSTTANWSLAKFGIERPSTLAFDEDFATMLDGDPRQGVYTFFDGTFWQYFDAPEGALLWGRSDAGIPMISYVELAFIQAEITMREGGDATADLAAAVAASFELVGVEDNGYIAALPAANMETIMTEAYKAYYGFNFLEGWSNWRRTGIPSLSPVPGGAGGLNPSGAIPQRFLYVESETQTNRENVDAARAAQGGALLDVPVWAFQ